MKKNMLIIEEAKNRIKSLTRKYYLNPNILKYFEEGKVYYSYLTAFGMVGSIDTISYEKRYEEAVKSFEREHEGYVVFHAIETITEYGELFSLLYVGKDPEEWEAERLYKDYISAYIVNFTYPELSAFGDIVISQYGESGALVRIG